MPSKEFSYVFAGLVILLLAYIGAAQLSGTTLLFVSIFSIIIGAVMLFFGFWGADYAFSIALGELDQSSRNGRVKGRKKEVYVPFMRNYTATEWWNLNWVITGIGAMVLSLGMLTLGLYL